MNRKNQKALKQTADKFLEAIHEEVSSCLILGDVDRLGRLVQVVHMCLDSELLEALRNKGFSKDIDALADKAGRITSSTTTGKEAKQ